MAITKKIKDLVRQGYNQAAFSSKKNAQIFASQGKEENLESIEKYLEIKEKNRIEELNKERREIINPYVDNAIEKIQSGVNF